MIKLDSYWNDKVMAGKVKQLRDELPQFFENVEGYDLFLSWLKFSDYSWLEPTPKAVETFIAEIDIDNLKLLNDCDDGDEDGELEDYDNLFTTDCDWSFDEEK